MAKSILALRSQAAKPAAAARGAATPDGVVREWLVLGPVPLPESFKAKADFKKDGWRKTWLSAIT